MRTRTLIVDDHPITLIGMRALLTTCDNLEVVAEAHSADALFERLEQQDCDLLVTDLMMPGSRQVDGIRLIQRLRRRYPELAIIVVTMLDNPALITTLLRLGIQGLVSKRGLLQDLPHAIRGRRGAPYLSPSLHRLLALGEAKYGKPLAEADGLSPREVEVLRLYGSGLSIGEIASQLARTKQTISAQKTSAMRKLGLDTNAALYLYIQEHGLA